MLTFLIVTISSLLCINGFTIQPKILNGVQSDPDDFPYFVHIIHLAGDCSAVLISDK